MNNLKIKQDHAIRRLIFSAKNLETKLALAELYAMSVIEIDNGIFEDIDVERHIVDFALSPNGLMPGSFETSLGSASEDVAHVLTIPLQTGGHTRLCERLCKMTECATTIVTGIEQSKVPESAISRFDNVIYTYQPGFVDRLQEIIKQCARYQVIVLHIHSEDITTTVALGILKALFPEKRCLLVNHADHLFTYGYSVSDAVLQVSGFGHIKQMAMGLDSMESFLGIPLQLDSFPVPHREGSQYLMVAASDKMKPREGRSAPKMVEHILTENRTSSFMVLGAKKTDWWWWRLKLKYQKSGRLKILPSMPYDDYLNAVNEANYCVDSHPLPGGTTFVEMYSKGLYPIGMKTSVSGYTPLEMAKVSTYEALLEDRQIDFEQLNDRLLEVHGWKAVEKRYLKVLKGEVSAVPEYLLDGEFDLAFKALKRKKSLTFDLIEKIQNLGSLSIRSKLSIATEFNIPLFILTLPLKLIMKIGRN